MSDDETTPRFNNQLSELKKQRGVLKGRLTLFANYVNKLDQSCLDSTTITHLQMRVHSAAIFFSEFNDIQSKIERIVDEKDLLLHLEYRESFECQYYSISALAKQMLGDGEQSESTKNNNSQCSKSVCIKLPQIKLPVFDGSFDKWLEFRNSYVSMIHDRSDLDSIQKFQYLKSSLSGSALHVISSLEFTAANYVNAWDLLEARYHNNRLLINNHIKALFAAPPLGKECPAQIRSLVDCVLRNLRALNSLIDSDSSLEDLLIIYLVVSKLDSATEREWENYRSSLTDSNKPSKPVKLEDLLSFLNSRSDMLDMINSGKKNSNSQINKQPTDNKRQSNNINSQTTLSYASANNNNKVSSGKSKHNRHNVTCPLCTDKHALYSCVKFLNMLVQDRLKFAKTKGVCLNCLRSSTHTIENCNFGPCKLCQQKHNALIHVDNSVIPNTSQNSVINNTLPQSSVLHCVSKTADNIDNRSVVFSNNTNSLQTVLLSTALVEIADIDNTYHTVRALLDSGSQNCFISQELCKRLKLPIIQSTIRICGVGQSVSQSNHKCDINMRSKVYDFNTTLHCLVLPSIISKLPSTHVYNDTLGIPSNILLADPTFNVPSDIDILIGADVFWDLLKQDKIKLHAGPYLQDTMVGWIISGPVYNNRFFENSMNAVQCNLSLSFDLRQFWEIEEVDIPPVTTEEDRYCEQLFSQTTVRDQHGRFCVKMPLKQSPDCLGDSYKMAKQRFLYLEKKLDRSPQYKRMYCEFMQEYEQLGHMTRVEEGNLPKPYYIIPHHGVYRESSVTTKLRVVFDASATTSNNNSLNEIQCVGPRLQNDIFSILLRFRQYRYVASADIEKFFRQTFIFPEQCNLQLIFWRTDNNLPLQIYRLNTVTYGTASAPYLSNRCLKQLAKECTDDVIASVINDDFYVDDLLVGNDKRDRLLDICSKTAAVLQSGCFPLRKWTFNFDVTSESTKDLCIGEHCQSKTLGVGWSNKNDLFYFLTSIDNNIDKKITKRLIMSVIAQIYDPLGLLAPAITTAKILLQKLWLAKISWDDEVPSEIAYTWGNFINSLQYLSDIFVPRYVMCPNAVYKELHIFSDASQTAYGAVAYIRSYNNIDESQVTSRLLCAKSKVAPIKALSIPRLELCGALVAAKLYNKIKNSLRLQFDKVYFWTDSTIVQAWVRTSPHLLKTFVQNRVVQINDLTSNTTWLHVKGKENPADILSRGVTFESMKGDNSSLWWCGPTFLCEPTSCWLPKHTNNEINLVNLPELKCSKTTTLLNVEPNNIVIDFERFSCFNRLQRTAAFMLRFIHNLRASRAGQCRKTGSLNYSEISDALVVLTRLVQSQSFSYECKTLRENSQFDKKSSNRTLGLGIFLDKDDIIRVGGRLSNSTFDYDKKHPVLLCHKHHFTWLLCSYEHKRLLHAGPQLLVATMRDRWWVLGARNLARQVVHKCVTCTRMKGNTLTPYMGDLPAERVEAGFPFMRCGVDYAGPISILNRKGRGSQLIKGYICLFVCFATRAVHLELVGSLSTQDYLLAFKRFISRRGKPCQVFSDNGKNFVGAEKELSAVFQNSNDIVDFASSNHIKFSFIPPYAPHFGGLWEAGVKSCKYHLRRVVGNARLTYEEFSTVLTQVEAVLNSRPISPISTDPDDYLPLTPAHFLLGRPLSAPASEDVVATSTPACRYRRLEQLRQHFWERWSKEYISELQRRTKWANKSYNMDIKMGSLVVIKENNLPPFKWKMGRVINLFPGKDGVSRVADIRTATGTIRRASSKICPLPVSTMEASVTPLQLEDGSSKAAGESVPVMKGPPCSSAEIYSTEGHKRHTLFAGTHVLQTRFYGNNQVLAKVVRTGFYTAKGELLKSILFPKPFGFQFYKDAVKFVIFMFCIAAIGMGYSIWLYVVRGSLVGTIVLRTLDIITIVVPPALPAAMTAGIVYSQNRLRKNRIFCVSPPRIVICGKLQVMCFDKTGTLTEDGLDFYSVIPARSGEKFGECVVDVGGLPVTSPLIQALASCHSLTSIQGQLKGDPLDLKMFEFTQWILEEPGPENTRYDNLTPAIVKPVTGKNEALQNLEDYDPFTMEIPYEIGLLRRFHFSSAQQSMGVIARVLGQPQMVYFVKGAPEKVAGMCNPNTLPENFSSILNEYTSNGFRVIGLAHKKLDRKMKWVDAQRVKRTSLECDMAFLGFLVMQNSLKPETTQVIRELHDASMRLIMVTGDNIMTAMSVARGCCMVQPHEKLLLITAGQPQTNDTRPPLIMEVVGDGGPPKLPLDAYVLALEGKTWAVIRTHYPELMPVVLTKGMVFGRFGPDQKTQLVTALQGEDLVVGMCGDGANDCGALKAAHVGISLSEADASVAAPFTSQEQNIKCVKLLALEGRCALSTSFAIFKYMALYSLIQFFSILILYNFYSILGNNQFLYIDLVLTTLLALSLGRASPGPLLTRQSPPVSLVALSSILPLVIQVSLVLLMQIASIYLLYAQPWFKPVEGGPDVEQVLCWENTVLFIITAFQYLIMACVYAKGWPFRQPFCTNYYMMITLVTQSIFVTVLLLCPWHWLAEFMEVEPMASADSEQTMFRIYLLLIPALHLILAIAVEATLSDSDKFSRLGRAMRRRCDKQAAGDAASPLWPEPHDHVQLC